MGSMPVIFADKEKRQVTADFKSKAANSPFVGEELTGSVKYTICDGEIVYQAQLVDRAGHFETLGVAAAFLVLEGAK